MGVQRMFIYGLWEIFLRKEFLYVDLQMEG